MLTPHEVSERVRTCFRRDADARSISFVKFLLRFTFEFFLQDLHGSATIHGNINIIAGELLTYTMLQ